MTTVLIIDDDVGVCDVLKAAVNDAGYTAITASGGQSGINKFAEQHPDMVLTDIVMPDVDGLETISAIRLIDPDARIAAMSGGSRRVTPSYYTNVAIKFGAMAVLDKPFRIDTLVETIEACLHADAPHREGSDTACSVYTASAHACDGVCFETALPREDERRI